VGDGAPPGVGRSRRSEQGLNRPGAKGTDGKRATIGNALHPLDHTVRHGLTDSSHLDRNEVQMDLRPDKLP
jgi:hypothetical protein